MKVKRAREILGKLASGKTDLEITGYVESLSRITDIAVRAAENEFNLCDDQNTIYTCKNTHKSTKIN